MTSLLTLEMKKASTPATSRNNSASVAITSSSSRETVSSALDTPTVSLVDQLRQRQAFYTLPRCKLPPASELQPIELFVLNAVQSQHQEHPDPVHVQGYLAIIDSLRRTTDPSMLQKVLLALRSAGNGRVLTLLSTNHSTKHAQLTHLIFRFNALTPPKSLLQGGDANKSNLTVYEDGSMLDAHLNLVLALVSAKSTHVVPALTNVWKTLVAHPGAPLEITHRLHAMLSTMMTLIPKARADLFPIISLNYPFWKSYPVVLTWYTLQCFKVLEYLPSIRKNVLELVIDKCLEMDVNIKISLDGDVKVEEETREDEYGTPIRKKVNRSPELEKDDSVDELSDKLDSLLELLFEFLLIEGSKSRARVRELYFELVPVFESNILTTHKSKFVQYCMFLLCATESKIVDGEKGDKDSPATPDQHTYLHRDFASKLLQVVVDPYRATMTRQSAACYLASFISRGSFVKSETVCESVATCLRWAEAYTEVMEKEVCFAADKREQTELHSLFYTICQAAFYIISFRSEAISLYRDSLNGYSATKEGIDDMKHVYLPEPELINLSQKRWTSLCNHGLQPLRFCLESVRSEFLHVAHAYELVDDKILEQLVSDAKRMSTGKVNKKAASSISTKATLENQRQKGGVGGLGQGSNPLKSFFPFDPLLLRRSHDYIESFYKHWQGPVEEEDALSIDEPPEGANAVFEMDDTSNDEGDSDDESDDDAGDEDDDPPVIVSDLERDGDPSYPDSNFRTPDAKETRELQRKAWTETMKRPRSQSMENGSW